jgi:opacity protein-like surface antigen
VFTQVSLSPQTSVQTEFRYRNFDHGDLRLFFDPDSFNPDERDKEQFRSVRLGLHHSFSPNSDLIASLIYRSADFDYNNFFGPGFDVKEKRKGYNAEVQHLFRSGLLSIISGAGHFQEDQEDTFAGQSTDTHPKHTNIYVYSLINYPKNLTLTIGGSVNFLKTEIGDSTLDLEEFNPKFGITWNPFKYTTLRLAAFRTLNRQLLTDQTIEPTQVAGFNQFFDDVEGTKAWRYGIGVDQKFCPQVYGGVEFSRRDLKVPGLVLDEAGSSNLIEGDWEEELGRAYIYWTPHPWLALSTEYQYERFKRPEEFAADNITRLNTHRLIFGIGFFHPSGFSVQFKPAYISQDGKFVEALSPFETRIVPKEDQFWDVDASIGYRLPKRLGFFTVVVKNLFDKEFKFQDTDPRDPRIQPKRLILAKLTLAF